MSVDTWQTSLCLVTSQASVPSNSLTCETGLVLRRWANSAGTPRGVARLKGKLGGSVLDMVEALRVRRGASIDARGDETRRAAV